MNVRGLLGQESMGEKIRIVSVRGFLGHVNGTEDQNC